MLSMEVIVYLLTNWKLKGAINAKIFWKDKWNWKEHLVPKGKHYEKEMHLEP